MNAGNSPRAQALFAPRASQCVRDYEQTRARPQGHDSPQAPIAARRLFSNLSFCASAPGLFPFRLPAEQLPTLFSDPSPLSWVVRRVASLRLEWESGVDIDGITASKDSAICF